ncbi:MAG TPA: carbamoyltransferase HypF, partial [Chromatiaceae bacterium]|nr:carbamoyltransferase HypF [Chromatiaceae bacterium]
ASCPEVVERLRQRKGREGKAFALMARDPDMVRRHAHLDDISEQILSSVAAPIVILPSQHEELAPGIAPGQDTLGFMLPYSPLHHLLMREMTHPVVLTSANSSEEPQCISNTEARKRLAGIADYLLLHDRGIVTRLDDSVVRVIAEQPRLLRRARGYAPQPIPLPAGITAARRVLAMGAELKSTFCLVTEQKAIVSQHLGNLENAATWTEYRKMLEHYQTLYDFRPELIVVDKHPGYLSTQFGKALAAQADIPLLEVQHHHAHIAACMAEHRLDAASPPVLGIVLDGLGYGDDVSIWGAEFLLADYQCCERLASIDPIPLIGGSKAMREPWRNTYAWLNSSLDWEWLCQEFGDLELMHFLQGKPLRNINLMIEKGINSPLASSAGRLFDAVAGALNICREGISFEGQAAIELESLASRVFQAEAASAYTLNG